MTSTNNIINLEKKIKTINNGKKMPQSLKITQVFMKFLKADLKKEFFSSTGPGKRGRGFGVWGVASFILEEEAISMPVMTCRLTTYRGKSPLENAYILYFRALWLVTEHEHCVPSGARITPKTRL